MYQLCIIYREEDVTKTMYTATYCRNTESSQQQSVTEKQHNKINHVCDKMREALTQANYEKYY